VAADALHPAGSVRAVMRPGRKTRRRPPLEPGAVSPPAWGLTFADDTLPLVQVGASSARFAALWANACGVLTPQNRNAQEVGLQRIIANDRSARVAPSSVWAAPAPSREARRVPMPGPGDGPSLLLGPLRQSCRGTARRGARLGTPAWNCGLRPTGLASDVALHVGKWGLQTGGRPVCCGPQETRDDRDDRDDRR
jgi:hypothetical protein